LGVFKRGESPSFLSLPLSFEGEGDKGGEVDNTIILNPDSVKSQWG